jgi:hypothetical protein
MQQQQQQHPTASTSSSRELLLELKRHSGRRRGGSGGSSTSAALPPYNLKLVRESLQDIQWHLKEAELEIQAAKASASVDGGSTTTTTTTTHPPPKKTTTTTSGGHDRFAPKPSILLHDSIVRRHKRCLLAYHVHRAHALQRHVLVESMRSGTGTTGTGTTGTSRTAPTSSFSHLTQNAPELDFCRAYDQLQRRYWQSIFPDDDDDVDENDDPTIDHDHSRPHLKNIYGSSSTLWIPPPSSSTGGNNIQVRCLIDQGPVVLDSGRSITLTKGSVLYLPKSDVMEWLNNGTLQVLEGEEVDF